MILNIEKLFIFDCDGVLVDSELIGNHIYAQALTNLGYSISAEECIRRFTGLSDQTAHDIIFSETGIQIPDNFSNLTQQITLNAFETQLQPLIFEFLQSAKEQNFEICVASSSPRNRVIRSLELTHQFPFFSHESIFTSQQVKRGKPAPDLFLFAAEQMGYQPQNCIVIEDSAAGIEAALTAKMDVVGFLGGSHAKSDWYQKMIHSFNIPIAYNSSDLMQLFRFNCAKI